MSRSPDLMKTHFSRRSKHELGRVHDEGDIDLWVATLRQLAGDQDEQWVTAFADMLSYAIQGMDD